MRTTELLLHLLGSSQTKTAANRRTSKKVVDSDDVLGKLAKLHQTKSPKR